MQCNIVDNFSFKALTRYVKERKCQKLMQCNFQIISCHYRIDFDHLENTDDYCNAVTEDNCLYNLA